MGTCTKIAEALLKVDPEVVNLYRVNAIGVGGAMFAGFGAFLWWMSPVFASDPSAAKTMIGAVAAVGSLVGGALMAAAFVPRKAWGYDVARAQLIASLVTLVGAIPTWFVRQLFISRGTQRWFEGGPAPAPSDSASMRRKVHVIMAFYALMSFAPYVFVSVAGQTMRESIFGKKEVFTAVSDERIRQGAGCVF